MPDSDNLLPRIGALSAARDALDLVAVAVGLSDTDLSRFDDEVPDSIVDVLAALANLSSLLLQFVVVLDRRGARVGETQPLAVSKARLLDRIRLDQELRGARAELDDFDEGGPLW